MDEAASIISVISVSVISSQIMNATTGLWSNELAVGDAKWRNSWFASKELVPLLRSRSTTNHNKRRLLQFRLYLYNIFNRDLRRLGCNIKSVLLSNVTGCVELFENPNTRNSKIESRCSENYYSIQILN